MLRKQKMQGKFSIIVVVIIATFMTMLPVSANNSMIFTIKAQRAENQISEAGYFDLKVKPGARQTLELLAKNNSSEEITLEVGAASASTTPSGELDYTSIIEEDETLPHSFSEILKIKEQQVKIPANGEKTIYVDLEIPENGFDGVLLGGIRSTDITERLKRNLKAESSEEDGIEIFNEYEFVVGVMLRENDKKVEPNFELAKIETGLSNYEPAIITSIRNSQPILIKDANFYGGIYPKGSDNSIFSIDGLKVEFAPNSVMKYEFVDKAGYGLEGGEYAFKGKLEFEGKTWNFEDDFIIEASEAAQINGSAIGQQAEKQLGLPTWIIIVIAIAVLLLLIIIILLLLNLKRKQK